VQTLEIDCRIRAFWVGLVYRGVFHSFSTAYDPQLLKYEPGNLLFHRLTDGLIREGVTKLDFGLGDAFYKSRFGDASWKEATVRVFAPSSKGAYLRSIFLVSNALDHLGRRLLSLTGFTDRLRTSWRRRMSVGQRAGH
jgi:CelD/BcsL family acetyltransferase involved in cellulose biosynthesis